MPSDDRAAVSSASTLLLLFLFIEAFVIVGAEVEVLIF